MKLITAYVRYEAFEPIRQDLVANGLPSLSIVEVKGSGRQRGVTEQYRGSQITNYLRPKLKFEIGVGDDELQTAIDIILKHARTDEVGDGKLFVTSVEEVYRIRTGETGDVTMQAHPEG
jgi:nitrogen regulatory protein P-II 1